MNTIAKLTITRSGYLIELTELGKHLSPGTYELTQVPAQANTVDELVNMARECGHWSGQTVEMNDVGLERFAALASAAMHAKLDELALLCAEAYQVVGSLLYDVGAFDDDHAQKILDNLSQARRVHTDVLPWPTFTNPNKEEVDAPTETHRD